MNVLVRKNNQERGPYTEAELRERLKSGVLSSSDLGQIEGETEWKPLSEILLASFIATEKATEGPTGRPARNTSYQWLAQPKVIGTAVLLLLLILGVNWLKKTSEERRQRAAIEQAQKQAAATLQKQQEQLMARLQQTGQAQFQSVQNMQQQYDQAQRDYLEKQKQEQAARDQAERQKAEVQKRLQEQLAQKQEESRKQAEAEKKGKVAQSERQTQEITKKREQISATIVRTKAKIEEQEVAPTGTAVKYAVSPHALHIAAATLKGSRPLMVIDGVSGPAFDELIPYPGRKFELIDKMMHPGDAQRSSESRDTQYAPVVFSEDGTRFAYVGRQGDQYVLMVDGKEFAHGPYIPEAERGNGPAAVDSLAFVSGSNRLRYIHAIPRPNSDSGGSEDFRGIQLVVEGDKNPPVESLSEVPIPFSQDGRHYAYLAEFSSRGPSYYERNLRLVVDGKLDPPEYAVPGFDYAVPGFAIKSRVPLFTGDSKHLITGRRRRLPDPQRRGQFLDAPLTVFVDQKQVLEAPYVELSEQDTRNNRVLRRYYAELEELSVAPAGTNYIAVFGIVDDPRVNSTPSHYRIFFNGRQIADVPKVETIDWSPDGKRYSVTCTTKNNSAFMIIDGKKEPEYRRVSTVYQGTVWASRPFTADSSKSVYLAWTDKEFLVVQGDESDGFKAIDDLTFSKRGAHIAFVATTDAEEKLPVVDGSALEPRKNVDGFVFNPDGTHYAFLTGGGQKQRGAKVVVDGVEQPLEYGGDFVHYTTGYEPDRKFVFSPDGKHVLYLASFGKVDASGYSVDHSPTKAVCLDDKLIPCEGEQSEITAFFTPDSKHVVWIDWGGKLSAVGGGSQYDFYDVPGFSIYVDGQLDGHFDCPTVHEPNSTTSTARFFRDTREACAMGPDGALTVIAQVGNVVKKLRITPSADTNLERFAALSQEQELGAQDKAEQQATPSNQ